MQGNAASPGDHAGALVCAIGLWKPAATTARGPQPAKFRPGTPGGKGIIAMANILVSIEKGIEIGAEDALKWLIGADKALHAAPEVIAALGTLIGAVEKPLADIAGAAQNPLNITLDIQTINDLKAAWPAISQFLASLGVKL